MKIKLKQACRVMVSINGVFYPELSNTVKKVGYFFNNTGMLTRHEYHIYFSKEEMTLSCKITGCKVREDQKTGWHIDLELYNAAMKEKTEELTQQ